MGLEVQGGLKTNLMRIAQKIGENKLEKNNPFRLLDMIRASIIAKSPE